MQKMFCINCGKEVPVTIADGEFFHTVKHTDMGKEIVSLCYGQFLENCEPSTMEECFGYWEDLANSFFRSVDDTDPDWDLNLEEPSQEEMAQMNLSAEMFLQDIGE